MNKERIQSERKNLHEYLEKKAERALQGECTAQKRLSEAEVEMDRNSRERRHSDIALYQTINNLNHKNWSYIRRISGRIELKEKTVDYLENRIRRIDSTKNITQECQEIEELRMISVSG